MVIVVTVIVVAIVIAVWIIIVIEADVVVLTQIVLMILSEGTSLEQWLSLVSVIPSAMVIKAVESELSPSMLSVIIIVNAMGIIVWVIEIVELSGSSESSGVVSIVIIGAIVVTIWVLTIAVELTSGLINSTGSSNGAVNSTVNGTVDL